MNDTESRLWAVTVKLAKNPAHDPRNKKSGPCPVMADPEGHECSDVTGEHHTFLAIGYTAENVKARYEGSMHVTRVEQVRVPA